jgi:hypothetical protein
MRTVPIALLGSVLVALAACGSSVPPPNTEWEAASNDVGHAESGGAPSVPDARLHLQLAREDLQKSKELINKDNRRALRLVELGRAEAQLALSLAKAQQAQDQARQAQAALQQVKGVQ